MKIHYSFEIQYIILILTKLDNSKLESFYFLNIKPNNPL